MHAARLIAAASAIIFMLHLQAKAWQGGRHSLEFACCGAVGVLPMLTAHGVANRRHWITRDGAFSHLHTVHLRGYALQRLQRADSPHADAAVSELFWRIRVVQVDADESGSRPSAQDCF